MDSPGLVYIGKSLALIGTCFWKVYDQCCDRTQNLFYIYDWETNSWSNEDITSLNYNELPGNGAVEISSYYLDPTKRCISIKWPKCIKDNVDYISNNGTQPEEEISLSRIKDCANVCQKTAECQFWVFDQITSLCTMKKSIYFEAVDSDIPV